MQASGDGVVFGAVAVVSAINIAMLMGLCGRYSGDECNRANSKGNTGVCVGVTIVRMRTGVLVPMVVIGVMMVGVAALATGATVIETAKSAALMIDRVGVFIDSLPRSSLMFCCS